MDNTTYAELTSRSRTSLQQQTRPTSSSTWSTNGRSHQMPSSSCSFSSDTAAAAAWYQPPTQLPVVQMGEPRRSLHHAAVGVKRKREPLEPLLIDVLRSAGNRGLVLTDLYRQVLARGADYPDDDDVRTGVDGGSGVAWRKNVRHILTVRDFFVKTGIRNPDGRGQFWRFDERKYDEYFVQKRRPGAAAATGDHSTDVIGQVRCRNKQHLYTGLSVSDAASGHTRCYLAPTNIIRQDAANQRPANASFRPDEDGVRLGTESTSSSPTMNPFQLTTASEHHHSTSHQSDDVTMQPWRQMQRPSCLYQQQQQQQQQQQPEFVLQQIVFNELVIPSSHAAVPFERNSEFYDFETNYVDSNSAYDDIIQRHFYERPLSAAPQRLPCQSYLTSAAHHVPHHVGYGAPEGACPIQVPFCGSSGQELPSPEAVMAGYMPTTGFTTSTHHCYHYGSQLLEHRENFNGASLIQQNHTAAAASRIGVGDNDIGECYVDTDAKKEFFYSHQR